MNSNNGFIYIIRPTCKLLNPDDVYYGSTKMNISYRYYHHIVAYKRWKKGKSSNTSVFNIFDKYGVENCTIQLVEQVPYQHKSTLIDREIFYITNNPCINTVFKKVKRINSKKPITDIQLYQSGYYKKYQTIKKLFNELPFLENFS